MNGVEPLAWKGMKHALNRGIQRWASGRNRSHVMRLFWLRRRSASRQLRNLFSELSHAASVTRNRVVALDDRSEPLASLLNRIVLAGEE